MFSNKPMFFHLMVAQVEKSGNSQKQFQGNPPNHCYFSLDQTDGPADQPTDIAIHTATPRAWINKANINCTSLKGRKFHMSGEGVRCVACPVSPFLRKWHTASCNGNDNRSQGEDLLNMNIVPWHTWLQKAITEHTVSLMGGAVQKASQ